MIHAYNIAVASSRQGTAGCCLTQGRLSDGQENTPGPAASSLLPAGPLLAGAVPAEQRGPSGAALALHERQPQPWLLRGNCLLPQVKPYRQLGKPCRQLGRPYHQGRCGPHHWKAWGKACCQVAVAVEKPYCWEEPEGYLLRVWRPWRGPHWGWGLGAEGSTCCCKRNHKCIHVVQILHM